MSLDPCGRVVLRWLSLCCSFGSTLLSGALWRAGPRWCRSVRSPCHIGGALLVCRRRCYQKAKGRDVYPRVQVNGLGCVCCVRAVLKCVGLGRGRGSRGDLVSSPLATALIPGAPAAPLPFLLAGAGVAPATPTPSCCPGPGGPSTVWHAPWRGRTRSVWTPPRRGGGTPCPASGAPYTPGGPAAWRGSAGLPPTAPAQSVPTAGDALGPPVAPPSFLLSLFTLRSVLDRRKAVREKKVHRVLYTWRLGLIGYYMCCLRCLGCVWCDRGKRGCRGG